MYIYTYIYGKLYIYIYIFIYVCVCICIHLHVLYMHTCMHACRQTDRQTERQTDRPTDRPTYMHTYIMHTYTHTHIHTYSYLQSHMFIHTYTFNSWFPKTTAPDPESRPNLVMLKGETNGSGVVLPTVRKTQIGNSGSQSTRTWRLASKMGLSEISEQWKIKTKTKRQRDLQHRYVVNDVNGKRPRQYNTRCFAIAF